MESRTEFPDPEDSFGDFEEDRPAEPVLETLYQILHCKAFNHKKTEGKDVGILSKLVTDETRQTFRCVDIGKNMEKSCFSMVLTDVNDLSRLVAHASFTDIPTDPAIGVAGKRWRKKKELEKATSANTLFISVFVHHDDEAMETCIKEIIANTFSACETVEYIILECPTVEYVSGGYIFSALVTELLFKAKGGVMKKLIIYAKDELLPKLKIRPGRELDLDDLMRLMKVDVKDLEINFKKSFFADLISMAERTKSTYVAEHEDSAVGMIVMSADINYTALNAQFHLEPFHGLYKDYAEDEIKCEPVESRRSESPHQETSDLEERPAAPRPEKLGLGELDDLRPNTVFSERSDGGGGGDAYRDKDHDPVGRMTSVGDLGGDYLNLPRQSSKQRFVQGAHRPESTKSFVDVKFEEQEELLEKVNMIMDDLRERGQTLNSAISDVQAKNSHVRLLTEAEDFINQCIYEYLHKTLIDDKALPTPNLNEPIPSTFLGLPNAIALQFVAIDKKYDVRILDLINGAFMAFPTRDYCIVITPSDAPELPWMKFFVCVTPKSTSLHPKTLHVLHRACFSNSLRCRPSKKFDCDKIVSLLESLYDADKIIADYTTSICSKHNCMNLQSFVAEVTSHESQPIVALVIIGQENQAAGYQVNYELDQYTYFDLHDPTDHAYVHHFVMNPIFQPFSKTVMKEIMRLVRKECFYHKIFPAAVDNKVIQHQSLIDNLDDFVPLIPRRRVEYALLNLTDVYDDLRQPPKSAQASTIPFMAYLYSKKFTYEPKTAVPNRVVFIGASETSLSCLAKILSSRYYDFKNLTLISTHGLPGGLPQDEIRHFFFPKKNGVALSMKSSEEWSQRLPIRSTVDTVFGTAIRILRKIKVVVVDDSKVVPYDILVIATGRQFIRPDCPEPDIVDERLEKFKRNLGGKSAEEAPTRTLIPPKPNNVFLVNTETDAAEALDLLRSYVPILSDLQGQVVVHGSCLEAYCCLRALIELGMSPHRITFVTSSAQEMDWETFHGYRDTAQLRALMTQTISEVGIEVLEGYEFRRWNLDEDTGHCGRVSLSTVKKWIGDMRPLKVSVPCLAYFPYCVRRVGDDIVTAITSACIPFNNGIMIDTQFQTGDPSIMAAGPCAIYNKKLCAEKFDHYQFASYDIGQVLGDFILKRILPPTRSINIKAEGPGYPPFPPSFKAPLVHYAELPGSWYYMHVSRPGWIPHCCREAECKCKDCECGVEIATGSVNRADDPAQKFFRLRLDKYQRVDGIECISRQKFPPSCLSFLYGHHAAFLNKLLERLEKDEIQDLYSHFCQPWVAALGMDRWLAFRQEIQDLMTNYDIAKGIKIGDFVRDYLDNLHNPDVFKVDPNILRHVFENTNLKAAIESKFLNFLKYNKAVLPMYARPDFVEETYNERIASPMYIPLHKNFAL